MTWKSINKISNWTKKGHSPLLNIPCDILYYQHINIYAFLCVETKALAITHLILYYLIIFPYSLHTVSFIAYILEFKTNKYLINNVYINLFFCFCLFLSNIRAWKTFEFIGHRFVSGCLMCCCSVLWAEDGSKEATWAVSPWQERSAYSDVLTLLSRETVAYNWYSTGIPGRSGPCPVFESLNNTVTGGCVWAVNVESL